MRSRELEVYEGKMNGFMSEDDDVKFCTEVECRGVKAVVMVVIETSERAATSLGSSSGVEEIDFEEIFEELDESEGN